MPICGLSWPSVCSAHGSMSGIALESATSSRSHMCCTQWLAHRHFWLRTTPKAISKRHGQTLCQRLGAERPERLASGLLLRTAASSFGLGMSTGITSQGQTKQNPSDMCVTWVTAVARTALSWTAPGSERGQTKVATSQGRAEFSCTFCAHGFVHAHSLPWSLGLQNTDRRDVDER